MFILNTSDADWDLELFASLNARIPTVYVVPHETSEADELN
jgi:hypothetical protein